MNYTVIELHIPPDFQDILIAELDSLQYEGFEETEQGLKAYIPDKDYNETALKTLIARYQTQTSIQWTDTQKIAPQNWNAVWESNFESVTVGDKIVVKAPFHKIDKHYDYVIEIAPEMAFGTGHHATTALVMEQMLSIPFKEKKVLDFGCGTGILAILAAMLGAQNITAIDNDPLSYDNTQKNLSVNQINHVNVQLGDSSNIPSHQYDIILANINRNVILSSFHILDEALNKGGYLIISGILQQDAVHILEKAKEFPLQLITQQQKEEWMVFVFKR